jgi:hypothetical protein
MTIQEIIDATYKPKVGLNGRDDKKLKTSLAILAELYFVDTVRQKWAIIASRGYCCSAEMAIKNIIFDVAKRSDFVIDITQEVEKFLTTNKHILRTA